MLADSYGVDTGTSIDLEIPLTSPSQDIAEMAGTTVETIIRTPVQLAEARPYFNTAQAIFIMDLGEIQEKCKNLQRPHNQFRYQLKLTITAQLFPLRIAFPTHY
ncbi:MAG: hypothetical protein R2688_06620 [Fimbriimonadaceae bacterium]